MLAELEGEFSVESIYSESLSLTRKLSADVTSLSGLVGGVGDVIWSLFGHAWSESLLPLLIATGVEVAGVEVSVRTWAAWTVLA